MKQSSVGWSLKDFFLFSFTKIVEQNFHFSDFFLSWAQNKKKINLTEVTICLIGII